MIHVLYHRGCYDGTCAAWAAWRKLGKKVDGEAVQYTAVQYQEAPPEIKKGDRVYIVDFSYPREVLEGMDKKARDILVLDHHASAEKQLKDLDFAIFSKNRSGAAMSWDHFHDEPRPKIVEYVQDRDLWAWKLPNSKAVNAALRTLSLDDFTEWDDLYDTFLEDEEAALEHLVQIGETILDQHNQLATIMCNKAMMLEIEGKQVPCTMAPVLNSEVGHMLCEKFPNAPFAMLWFQLPDGEMVYSLRSQNRADCSEFAALFGGGGHPNAAGFKSRCTPTEFAANLKETGLDELRKLKELEDKTEYEELKTLILSTALE